jgi:FixJ family two-component response regulator/two-component sensor histidine kinase
MEATGGGPRPEGEKRRLELSSLADFAAGLAHEINNPLAVIIEAAGWVEDLLEDEETKSNLEEMRRSLRQIATQAGRCKEITHNLLSFARRVPGRIYDVDLNELVREVAATFDKRAASLRVAIALHLHEGLPRRRLSPTAIQQLLVNLLNNALDAFEPGGGRIDVTTRREGGDVLLDVADTGTGIPQEIAGRIFDPFFTTKPVGKGTGLGLSICFGIAEDMGGSISVDSQVGRGTTFHVRIPERPAGEGDLEPARLHSEEEDSDGIVPRSPTVVLLVDNEEGFVETVAKRLERRSLMVLVARSGQEAIARLEAHGAVDVVVLDVKLPDMDGTEVLKELKRRAPLVEVILLSGHSTVESAIDGMRLGAFDYLVKPCELRLLLRQIDNARAKKARQEERIMEARLKEITMRRA